MSPLIAFMMELIIEAKYDNGSETVKMATKRPLGVSMP